MYHSLEIYTFDTQEYLSQAMRSHHIQLPFCAETRTVCCDFRGNSLLRWDVGKEEQSRQCVIQITQRVDECRIPLLDDMVKTVLGTVVMKVLGGKPFATSNSTIHFLCKCFVLTERLEHWLMLQVGDILGVVKCCGRCRALVGPLDMPWLTRKNTFENA